jgi:cellulose synthase/poly-beta-1,6-N-acetylglucosamine synthase-like glycosyltransferase/spore germination protein YaaH/peptidoglycan/xylan/chitin deacetylase (PgdA/CDA1 family)
MAHGFIFHDPTGKRWTRVRHAIRVAAVVLCVFAAILVLAVLTAPQVPALGLGSVAHVTNSEEVRSIIAGERPAKNVPFGQTRRRNFVKSADPLVHHKIAARVRDDQPLVFGYYVNWDPSSMVSLRLNLSRMTHLLPEWLVLANGAGDLNDETDQTVVRIAADAHLPIIAMLTNFRDGWQAKDLHTVLTNSESRKDLIDNIYDNLIEHKFAGVSIDFEQLGKRDREAMVRFMEELRAKLHPNGLLLTQSVPVEDPAYDLPRLAQINDYIVAMAYDEHYQSGEPGPVASQDWFEKKLDELAKVVPGNKTVIGVGNYGYDWVIGGRGSTEVGYDDVMAAAQQNKTAIAWDERMQNPVLRYDARGSKHEVWFLDAVTALNQIQATGDSGFRGIALWRMGAEDPEFWTLLGSNKWPEEIFPTTKLFNLSAQKTVSQYGGGEVLRITSLPQEGKRNVWRTKDDDYAEQYQSLPSYFVVEASGAQPKNSKLVSLSFDDGPDPQFTPAVLSILKEKQVPATFFVVGINAEENPGLLEREYAGGHTIGNHTYDHPNVATISEEATRQELNATQRLIENATGHATTLFRPPYNADSEPRTPDEILPILRAQNMGYVTVGERIDPQDWRRNVTPDEIISEVLSEAGDGGQLILLHDAGGDRTATVQALPKLIDTLRGHGYRFVSLPDLLGKSRDEMMPVPSASELRWARIEGKALDAKGGLKRFIGVLFLAAIYLTLARSLIYGTLAIIQKFRARRLVFDPSFHPPVSVVIAAYNEEAVIARTVGSILDNGYEDLEIVVVDDGSKDATYSILKDQYGSDPRVRILTQANGGKSSALNRAIAQTRNNILVAVDADTIFRKGAIGLLARHFSDPQVGAVSGNARVGNRHNWITRFQSIEYICGFNLDRRALDVMNAITVVPGAVGAWRKDLIEAVGGFGHDTLAEDTDLTLAIRRAGYKIRYEERAIAYTEAPETTKALAKQRFRWAFGTLQAAWKHREVTLDPRYGFLGVVAMPSIWLFQVALAAISPFAEVAMLIALYAGNWRIVLLFYLAFFVLEALTALLAYALEWENPKDLLLLFFQRIYFRGLMQYVLGKSLIFALRGRLVGWGKLERTARVQEA